MAHGHHHQHFIPAHLSHGGASVSSSHNSGIPPHSHSHPAMHSHGAHSHPTMHSHSHHLLGYHHPTNVGAAVPYGLYGLNATGVNQSHGISATPSMPPGVASMPYNPKLAATNSFVDQLTANHLAANLAATSAFGSAVSS